eukprot:6477080-Alexandrium_andersonii.AAC.1
MLLVVPRLVAVLGAGAGPAAASSTSAGLRCSGTGAGGACRLQPGAQLCATVVGPKSPYAPAPIPSFSQS